VPRLELDPVAEARRQWVEHGWVEAADGMAAVTSIMRAHQIVISRVDEVLRPLGLTFARYELLMLLHFSSRGSLPVTKASARLQVHSTSVTSAVDRLERDGLVRRVPNPADGRGVLVELTEAGRALALDATERLNTAVFEAPPVPGGRLGALLDVLRDLRREAGDFD